MRKKFDRVNLLLAGVVAVQLIFIILTIYVVGHFVVKYW